MKNYLFTVLFAFALSLVFCLFLIPILRKLKAGQNILVYVKEHKNKSGTPTMGGLAFIIAAILASLIFIPKIDRTALLTIVTGLAYMCVGLLDDFLKQRHKQNLGLKAWQKFVFQFLIACLISIFCYRNGFSRLYLPFFGGKIELGAWCIPFIIFVFLATVNAVNLTDGLDGLAAGVSIPFFLALAVIICLEAGDSSQAIICFSLVGALIAYLLFNASPATVFMGDTGSLALGGFAACIAVFTGNALYIAVIGVMFVLSVISVILQVIYYKATGGKRIFLMSPLHHHFQKKGYSETKIAYAYFTVTIILGIIAIVCIL